MTDQVATFNPPIVVGTKSKEIIREITTPQELTEFVDAEVKAWQWLNSARASTASFEIARDQQRNWLAEISAQSAAILQRVESGSTNGPEVGQFQSLVRTSSDGRVLLSGSFAGRKLLDLAESDPQAALSRLVRLILPPHQLTGSPVNFENVIAAISDMSADKDIDQDVQSGQAALESLLVKFSEQTQRAKGYIDGMTADVAAVNSMREIAEKKVAEAISKFQNQTNSAISQMDLLMAKNREGAVAAQSSLTDEIRQMGMDIAREVEAGKKGLQAEIENLRSALRSDLRLQAPVTYWNSRYRLNFWTMWISLGALLLFGIVLIGAFVLYGSTALDHLPKTTEGNLWIGEFVILTIPTVAYFWLMRYVGKVFINSQNNAADAANRATMTETFLALSADGASGVGAAERLLILQALFRPGPASEADEAAEAGILEILQRLTPTGATK